MIGFAVAGFCVLSAIAQAAVDAFTGPNRGSYIAAVIFVVAAAIVGSIWAATSRHRKKVEAVRREAHERQLAWEQEQRRVAEAAAAESARHAAAIAAEAAQRQQRWEWLVGRFGEDVARKVLAGEPWLGATKEMIREALGPPDEVGEKVLKTKTKTTFKYLEEGGRRARLKITFDDDEVVGWDKN